MELAGSLAVAVDAAGVVDLLRSLEDIDNGIASLSIESCSIVSSP